MAKGLVVPEKLARCNPAEGEDPAGGETRWEIDQERSADTGVDRYHHEDSDALRILQLLPVFYQSTREVSKFNR
jgi:hypothetical protein